MKMKGMKTGGRKKGSQNKITVEVKNVIRIWIEMHMRKGKKYSTVLQEDFAALEPKDRVKYTVEFAKMVMPRDIKIDMDETQITIEDKLRSLAQISGE